MLGDILRKLGNHGLRVPFWGLALTAALAALYVSDPLFLRFMDGKLYDVMLRSRHTVESSGATAVVDLDENSLAEYGQWPWPRYRVALLVEKIRRAGAAAVGLDILFAEPDRTSPHLIRKQLLEELGVEVDFTGLPAGLEDNDQVLAGVLSRGPYVLGYYFDFEPRTDAAGRECLLHPLSAGHIIPPGAEKGPKRIFQAHGASCNIAALSAAAPASGFFNVAPDPDGVIRRAPLFVDWEGSIHPSLALATLLLALDNPQAVIRFSAAGVESLRLGQTLVPLDQHGQMLLHFRGPQRTLPYHSAADVLRDRLPPGSLEGRIVFLGASAAGLKDLRVTPLDTVYPGVEVHATLVDNILQGDFLFRPDWITGLEFSLILVLGALSTLLFARTRGVWMFAPAAAGLPLLWYGSGHLLSRFGVFVSPLMPMIVLGANFALLSMLRFWKEESEKKRLSSAFQQYVSPALVDRILERPELLNLGGRQQELTVMFSDIRGFTSLSESMSPEELVRFMNDYLTAMTNVLLAEGGTLDKYVGDAIMAFFGAPVEQRDHALRACRTALKMFEVLHDCREQWCSAGRARIEAGMGINSGEMVVGNMGSPKRFNYTVMGDHVNLAARLEGLTKYYGVKVLISQYVHDHVKDHLPCREMDLVAVKGKARPVRIHELLGEDYFTQGRYAFVPPFERALAAYREQRWEDALRGFEEVLRLKPADKPTLLYMERCRALRAAPPPTDWDGVWRMTTK